MDDRTARFDRLFDEHRRAVYALFFASSHHRQEAEDGVQETFLRVWCRLDALPPEGERAYVLRTARSVAVDAARRARVRPVFCEEVELGVDDTHLGLLDAAIRALPEELRVPLVMTALGGMESGEIGEVLGKPPGTIRYLVHKARARLAEAIG